MGVNAGLLNETVKEIKDGLFKWNQEVWVKSNPVPAGLSSDGFENECGTSYCFAGRVATRKRDPLYTWDQENDVYHATAWLVPLGGDDGAWSQETMSSRYYRPTMVNGKTEFLPYQGDMILAEYAARQDLGINSRAADHLFAASNDIEDIENYVENIIEDGPDYGEYEDHGCPCCDN